MQLMHDYYNQCYVTGTEEYMTNLEKASKRTKNDMYNNTLDGILAGVLKFVQNVQKTTINLTTGGQC